MPAKPRIAETIRLQGAQFLSFPHFQQQVTCQFWRLFDPALASILHGSQGEGGSG